MAKKPGYFCWILSCPYTLVPPFPLTPRPQLHPRPDAEAFLSVAWEPLASESPGMIIQTQNR